MGGMEGSWYSLHCPRPCCECALNVEQAGVPGMAELWQSTEAHKIKTHCAFSHTYTHTLNVCREERIAQLAVPMSKILEAKHQQVHVCVVVVVCDCACVEGGEARLRQLAMPTS